MSDSIRPEDFVFACPKISEVEGDGPVRFCGLCNKEVINLSEMTAEDAKALRQKQAHAPSCMQVTLVNGRPRHRKTSNTLRNVTLALGLGIGGLALTQWTLEPPRATAAPVGGGAINSSAFGSVMHQTEALHASVNAAIAQAEKLGQPVPKFTPPPPNTPPPVAPPSAAPSTDEPCEEEMAGDVAPLEPLGGEVAPAEPEPRPLGGRVAPPIRPLGGAPKPMPPEPIDID